MGLRSQRYAVLPDFSCAAGLVAAAGVLQARPRERAPSLNRTGTAPKWIRRGSVLAASSLNSRSDRYQHRTREPRFLQSARRNAAATADTILVEIRGAKRLTACCTIPPSGCRPAVPASRLASSRPTMTIWILPFPVGGGGGADAVASTRTRWTRALVLPAS